MMMTHQDDAEGDAALEALFEEARGMPVEVPDGLMRRVLADADTVQNGRHRRTATRPSLWAQCRDVFGGWQGMGGLVAATCAGLWIGWSQPASLPDAGDLILGYQQTTDTLSSTAELTSFGWDLEEG